MFVSRKNPLAAVARNPWVALAVLWLVFELPMAFVPDGFSPGAMRPTGEVLALLTAYALSLRMRFGRPVRWLLAVFVVALLVVRLDRTLFFGITRSEPLLYDQMFMVRHFLVLLGDLWSFSFALAFLGVTAGLVALGFLARALMRRTAPLFEGGRFRRTAQIGAVAWVIVLVATIVPSTGDRPWVRWMTPEIARNLSESRRLYQSVQQSLTRSPYAAYDGLHLRRKPDVFVFFIESYGKVMAEQPDMRPIWVDELQGMEGRLSNSGWNMVSGYSTAPVSGSRSWLAVGSIWTGTTLKYEAVYRQFTLGMDHTPTLVKFFQNQGYDAMHLAPSDRPRPGVTEENTYGYDQYIGFEKLDYRGPKMGWGIVPDQYALGYTEEHFLSSARHPLFFNFHMVSSHATWATIPEYVKDWHTLNGTGHAVVDTLKENGAKERLERYSHFVTRYPYMGKLTATLREAYERSVFYDFRVIEDFLSRRDDNTLVVVMGDHQPPVVSPEMANFDVPVHVFARDRKLLEEFEKRGFSNGLVLGTDQPAVVQHAGLFSVFVRALAECCGDSGAVPPYLPLGVALGS